MNIRTAFSSYLKADDLTNPVQVTIDYVQLEILKDAAGKEDEKPVLYFRGTKKGMVLNVTNANVIANIVGDDETDNWSGHLITLYKTTVEAFGKMVPAVRVQIPEQPVASIEQPSDPTQAGDVPF